MNDAIDAWVPCAVDLLTSTAKKYNGVVTYKQLADFVQTQSGVKHDALLPNWIGGVLAGVITHCEQEQILQLGALCVKEDGTVGDGYRHSAIAGGETSSLDDDQLDDHAARMRLECYRYFGANLPPGGGEPTLTPRASAARERKNRQSRADELPRVCAVHFTVLPATGVCDECL
ncbi:hypothetical protein ACWDTI_05035 [Gordonia sp. NPDC003424]